jgi:hypothetical protein
MSTIIEMLVKAIRLAAVHNPDAQSAPCCILWPDGERQWEPVAARLQAELPEMFCLGEYDVGKRTGPAIWLRCVIANKAPKVEIPSGATPVLYLPGVSRQDLRAVESCPDHLKPIAELQYSGVIWSQVNAKDWTILAFIKSEQGGLGFDVSQDGDSRHAMQLSLYRLLDEDIDHLKGKRLDKDFFNTLLTGGDPVRDLLQWLDQGSSFQAGRDKNAWIGFVEVCKSQLGFDPQNDGNLKGAELIAWHKGSWLPVWERFCEAPKRYPNIPSLIRKCPAPNDKLFWLMDNGTYDGWPQWNEDQEKSLRKDLFSLANLPAHVAREKLLEIEKRHARRRTLVWAELGESPFACAMEHLCTLADATAVQLAAGTLDEIADSYRSSGWKADDAVLRALACVSRQEDFEAIKTAIRAVYLPWVEDAARYLQKMVYQGEYPGKRPAKTGPPPKKAGECILFVDGMRFDIGCRLDEILKARGMSVKEKAVWAAIPTVTATGKPAVTPVAHLIEGQEANADFEPCIASTGQSLKGGYHLQKLLSDEGWHLPDKSSETGAEGPAWCEAGNIDHEGHERGWKLARHIEAVLGEIAHRIEQLVGAGFETIRIVTDHGWLLVPGGLPKTELSSSLAENVWGRCAAVKPGASTHERLFPWYWNPHLEFALANGISCYRAGMEYAHGGLSLQECLIPELEVSSGRKVDSVSEVRITDVNWKGMRCKVALEGDAKGVFLDLRNQPGNPATSIVMGVKPFKEDGTSSVVVENEEMEGLKTTIVVFDSEGALIAQRSTVVGKEGD